MKTANKEENERAEKIPEDSDFERREQRVLHKGGGI